MLTIALLLIGQATTSTASITVFEIPRVATADAPLHHLTEQELVRIRRIVEDAQARAATCKVQRTRCEEENRTLSLSQARAMALCGDFTEVGLAGANPPPPGPEPVVPWWVIPSIIGSALLGAVSGALIACAAGGCHL